MQNVSWYVNRLGRMSAAEIAWRAAQVARATTERLARADRVPSPSQAHASNDTFAFVHRAAALEPAPYIARAQNIIAGRLSLFSLKDCQLGHPPQWNRDPLTHTLAPLLHAASLDYRDERLVGNIKYLWEPNRHLHLPALAQAYALTRDLRYAMAVRIQVDSWIAQCPYGRGPNWSSSLELAIRLINWSIAWQLLGGFASPLFAYQDGCDFRERWLQSVYQHARAIIGRLSRFSSANNHLIGEAAGVWIASLTWNLWPRMQRWGRQCRRILAAEALAQNAPDGGNREQAFAYQQFVLDFLLIAGLAARAADQDFPDAYWQRLESMMEFIAAMMDSAGHVPMIGDADDGYVVRLSPDENFDNFRSLLATGAILFERPDFARKAGSVDDKTCWLTGSYSFDFPDQSHDMVGIRHDHRNGAHSGARTHARRAGQAPLRVFPQSGYYLLGDRFDTPDEIRLLADAGPLGYLSIAAHGHADALSIVLNVGGHEVLVDPGTYAYHTQPDWRGYFRSTRAHNTVMVDELDQSKQSGNFMWSRHAQARCLQFASGEGQQRFVAEHDGYCRLADPVTHRREIIYSEITRSFLINDTLDCAAAHRVCRHWHFCEALQPFIVEEQVRVRAGRYLVRIVPLDLPAHTRLYYGGDASQGGWVSRAFGCRQPATTVAWHSWIAGTTVLRTQIFCERNIE